VIDTLEDVSRVFLRGEMCITFFLEGKRRIGVWFGGELWIRYVLGIGICVLGFRGSVGQVHGPARCTLSRDSRSTSTRYYTTNMDAIELALKDLRLQDKTNISATARVYNVQRSTLSRRFNKVTNSAVVQH
jgi:hypothetical protein